jgi:drug/metabolite transporter (DMT)-like permease
MKKALVQLHIAILLWGATGTLGEVISLNEIWLVWYRLLITVITLTILNLFSNKITNISFKQKLQLFFIGCFQAAHWVCFFASIKYGNVAIALITLSSSSFFTVVLSSFIYKTKIKTTEILLSFLSIIGIFFIFYTGIELKAGIIFGLLSALLVSLVPILNKQYVQKINAPTITIWNMTGGFVFTSIALPFYYYQFPTGNIFPVHYDWLWLIILSWCCTIITWHLSLQALQKVSAFTQNLLLNLEPIYGILIAAIFLQEYKTYTFNFYIGIVFIISAILLQTKLISKKEL